MNVDMSRNEVCMDDVSSNIVSKESSSSSNPNNDNQKRFFQQPKINLPKLDTIISPTSIANTPSSEIEVKTDFEIRARDEVQDGEDEVENDVASVSSDETDNSVESEESEESKRSDATIADELHDAINTFYKSFTDIMSKRAHIDSTIVIMQKSINDMKVHHKKYRNMNLENMYVHALDSINFQSKICRIEFSHIVTLFAMLNNHMYCEYYKLYSTMATTKERITIYDDLDEIRVYSNNEFQDLFDVISKELHKICDEVNEKKLNLDDYKKDQSIGVNVNNFITTYIFDLNVLMEKFNLYMLHIKFFQKIQNTRYDRVIAKLDAFDIIIKN